MKICCDTSFIFAAYGSDTLSPEALSIIKKCQELLLITELNQYEFTTSLCLSAHRKIYTNGQIIKFWKAFSMDLDLGLLRKTSLDFSQIWPEAMKLSWAHTLSSGHRAFDVLHIAAALHLQATHFFTFDQQQMRLAKAVGLKVNL